MGGWLYGYRDDIYAPGMVYLPTFSRNCAVRPKTCLQRLPYARGFGRGIACATSQHLSCHHTINPPKPQSWTCKNHLKLTRSKTYGTPWKWSWNLRDSPFFETENHQFTIHRHVNNRGIKILNEMFQTSDHNIKPPTPWKINMEPTNHPFRKENDLPNPV